MPACATSRERAAMTLHLAIAGLTALALLLYLVAVLVRPEKF
jgi:K+-transporting ATPase KdpF subunit